MSLRGRVAIVVGASGGIGTVTVRALAAQQATVVMAAQDDAMLVAIAEEATREGWPSLAVPTDIRDRAQIDALVRTTLERFGRIDILANVAGVGSSPSLSDDTDADIERVISVNLLGAARMMHAVLPTMKAQREGAIVNIGSVAGEVGVMGIYSASKFGLRGLCDTVRREVKSHGITVTLLEPGFVRTEMNAAMGSKLPSPEIVSRAVIAAISHPRRARLVPWTYRFPVLAAKLFPGAFDRVFGDARIQERLNRDARAGRQQPDGTTS